MKCPNCGEDMNHHAEKVDYAGGMNLPESVDPAVGGELKEFHTCPKCGISASRPASRAGRI